MSVAKIIIPFVFIALVISVIIFGCRGGRHKKSIYPQIETISFEKNILPVFINNCGVIGCHDQQSAAAGYVFTDYNSIIKGVIPYNPDKSTAFKAIIGEEVSPMPPGKALKENEKNLIRVWIGQGAENTTHPRE